MGLARGIARPLLLVGLIVLICSADVAEAGLFSNLFKGMFDQVKGMMEQVTETIKAKFSVLSGIFGEGVTRGDLSLPEIINGAFSRNNSIFIGNSTTVNMDWKLGDGSNVFAAISTGGSVAVSNNNGTVTITTGKQPQPEKEKGEEKEEEKPKEKKCPKGKEGRKCRREKREEKERAEREAAELAAKEEAEKNGTISIVGSDMNDAFFGLLENWDDFVTSSIWDAQDEPQASTEAEAETDGEDSSLQTSQRVINGIFFGNGVPSGASFAVKLFYNNEENFYCSGSLIGYPYAMTAAHCGVVVGDEVRVGGRLLRSGYQAKVAEVFTHPKFEAGSLVHDIAIVRLDNLMDKKTLIKTGVKAARLNKDEKFPEEEFVGVLSGHGSVQTDGKGVSDELRTTRHTVYEMSKCQEEITQGNLGDEESYLCAGDGTRSTTCVGDSGAGMWRYRVKTMANGKKRRFYEIFAVVSFGEVTDEALCPLGPPTIFQRTSENYDWIVDVVGKENMP